MRDEIYRKKYEAELRRENACASAEATNDIKPDPESKPARILKPRLRKSRQESKAISKTATISSEGVNSAVCLVYVQEATWPGEEN